MKEKDIRSQSALNEYLELVRQDCDIYFKNKDEFVLVDCPACGSKNFDKQFIKSGFEYVTCRDCSTLYANKRPSLGRFKEFYANSRSTNYWINSFFKPFIEARREKIFAPRAEYFVDHFGVDRELTIGDIGAGFGLFLEELKKRWPKSRFVAIEPSLEQSRICSDIGLEVENCLVEELKGYENTFDVLTAFELFEHLSSPRDFVKVVYTLLKPGGVFLMSTLNGQGFDIQLLWEKSKAVSPPHHLNFFNPCSLTKLLDSEGFTTKELSTPGKLDWSIVESMILDEGVDLGRFWNMLSNIKSADVKGKFQTWLSDSNLSSHMRAIAVKGDI